MNKGGMMKLHEIENYLEKKVTRTVWGKDQYIYFSKGYWITEIGSSYTVDYVNAENIDWELYKPEPKTKTMKLEAWVEIKAGTLHYRREGYNMSHCTAFKRCPELDRTVTVELE